MLYSPVLGQKVNRQVSLLLAPPAPPPPSSSALLAIFGNVEPLKSSPKSYVRAGDASRTRSQRGRNGATQIVRWRRTTVGAGAGRVYKLQDVAEIVFYGGREMDVMARRGCLSAYSQSRSIQRYNSNYSSVVFSRSLFLFSLFSLFFSYVFTLSFVFSHIFFPRLFFASFLLLSFVFSLRVRRLEASFATSGSPYQPLRTYQTVLPALF